MVEGSTKLTNDWLKGINTILGDVSFPPKETKAGYRLLIRGLPGTGKTTLGLHFFHHQLMEHNAKGLLMPFQESLPQLDKVASQFKLDFKSNSPDTAVLSVNEFPDFELTQSWINKRIKRENLCILIDGLSILKSLDPKRLPQYLASLLEKLKGENIFLIIIAEEDIVGKDHFFEYMVDGVINLSMEGHHAHRFLEISKLRYIDYARGKHGFDLFQYDNKLSALRIYPNAACHYIREYQLSQKPFKIAHKNKCIESGIGGLEKMMMLGSQTGVPSSAAQLHTGDVFIITAEPGTDKAGIGLSFIEPINEGTKINEDIGLWVTFGPSSLGKIFSREFYRTKFEHIERNWNTKQNKFKELYSENGVFHPDQVVYDLIGTLSDRSEQLTRVVVDGLGNIGAELNNSSIVNEYIIWLARLLSQYNAVSLIFVDLPKTFQPIGNIPMEWESEAKFVGHLRWFEINNQLKPTFVLTKSRHNFFRSVPHYVEYSDKNKGIRLEDRGWSMINMLSGQMNTVQEAKVFLKFFDHNYSTRQVHEPIFDEFQSRYSEDQIFAHVHRLGASPKHWSFRGYVGPGHSNTKIVCMKQYIMDVLKDDGVLIKVPPEDWESFSSQTDRCLPSKKYIKAKAYSLWGLACRRAGHKPQKDHGNIGLMIPLYADIGVLCCQIDKELLRKKAIHEYGSEIKTSFDEIPNKVPSNWHGMFELNKKFKKLQKKQEETQVLLYPQWIHQVFAMPDLTSDLSGFMTFFLEILMDYSGMNMQERYSSLKERGLVPFFESEALINTINLLRKFVITGTSKSPLESIHYHTAFFSRRWYSKVDQYPMDDSRLPDIEKYTRPKDDDEFDEKKIKKRIQFSVKPLPSTNTVELDGQKIGISCLEFYSVGVIREALAPETAWMFISELASNRTDRIRFETRRGLPIQREHWAAPRENKQREDDQQNLDLVLDDERFFCNFWIKKYWNIESRLQHLLREIFIGIECHPNAEISEEELDEELNKIQPGTKELQSEFIGFLNAKS